MSPMTTGRTSLCHGCSHFTRPGALSLTSITPPPPSCAAFPSGIPTSVLSGYVDHRQPVLGDHGIQFTEQVPGTVSAYDAALTRRRRT